MAGGGDTSSPIRSTPFYTTMMLGNTFLLLGVEEVETTLASSDTS